MVYRKVNIEQGQCLKDIAITKCGDAAALFEICLLNDLSPTGQYPAGMEILVPAAYNPAVVEYLSNWGLEPATEETPDEQPPGGIGYMAIGSDFRVS